MKLNSALKVEAPLKPTAESSVKEKKCYEDWEYSNGCCLMIIENHMEDYFYESIPKSENAKNSWMLLARNTQGSRRMRKMSYLIIIG